MADWPEGKISYDEAGYNNATLNYELAKVIEAERRPTPGNSPNPMGNEVVNTGAAYDSVNLPGGSLTNLALMLEHKIELDQGGGSSGDVSIYAPTAGEVREIFGPEFRTKWQAQDGYLYTLRDPSGRPHAVTLDDVLALIGRTYGQEG